MIDKIKDPFGLAVQDYHTKGKAAKLEVVATHFDDDEMPVHYLFRSFDEMPTLEQKALCVCKGKVLDVGAGAGCHSIHLQSQGFDVTALERSERCAKVLAERGIAKVVCDDINQYYQHQYDTLLLLMNGIGLAGNLENLIPFLKNLKRLLKPGGQILVDSSDIVYLFENEDGSIDVDLNASYYGDMQFQFKYKEVESDWFPWLYVGIEMLETCAKEAGFGFQLIAEGEHYDYVAKLLL